MITWLSAFLLTLTAEAPVWLAAARPLGWKRSLLVAFGTSAITHPLLWFALPWDDWPYLPTLIAGELAVVGIEALFAGFLGVRQPWLWSLFANSMSIAIGVLSRHVFGWP